MGDDGSAQTQSIWPLPKFHFRVEWGETSIDFQEVSGLDSQPESLEYRAGQKNASSTIKMPGMRRIENIVMKKGVPTGGDQVNDLIRETKMNRIARRQLTITLLDEQGLPTMVWKVRNAFPVRISSTDMQADHISVAIDSIEFAHEGFTIENA